MVNKVASSFRDPSGFVFTQNGSFFRQINKGYKDDYNLLKSSGLYESLVSKGFLIPHEEVSKISLKDKEAWKTIRPVPIPFISYPYEWSFGMLKDAALLTLKIAKIALAHGMTLKDATAYNVQFLGGKPILIDTLSFEKYEEGKPWQAYKQYIEHFLSPLSLMSMVDVRLGKLSSLFIDGISLDLSSRLLPLKSRLDLSLLIHIHAHASTQRKYNDKKVSLDSAAKQFGKTAFRGLLDNLESWVTKVEWKPKGTQWADYYEQDKNNYETQSLFHKGQIVEKFIKKINPKIVCDMGANAGFFSEIAAKHAELVVAADVDYGAIEKTYRDLVKRRSITNILPLFCDLTNPTPAIGWNNTERASFFQRGPVDAVLALALIHHLAISHNVPFEEVAATFSHMGKNLIIEFVDKKDSQVQILLRNRKDIFPHYTKENFEKAFSVFFKIKEQVSIRDSKRTLYFMEAKS